MDIYLDLRGTPCPLNFVRCCLAIEELKQNQNLKVDLDRGEPESMVLPGLKDKGYEVKILFLETDWIRFLVSTNAHY